MPGADWREAAIGTNGIGTALANRGPVQVYAAEHFCAGIKRWTCRQVRSHRKNVLNPVNAAIETLMTEITRYLLSNPSHGIPAMAGSAAPRTIVVTPAKR